MIKQVLLDGKPAYKISAVYIHSTPKAALYDCEGDHVWVPKSVSKYDAEASTLTVLDWYYNQNF